MARHRGGVAEGGEACALARDPRLEPDPSGAPDCTAGGIEATGPSRLADIACAFEAQYAEAALHSLCSDAWGLALARAFSVAHTPTVFPEFEQGEDGLARCEMFERKAAGRMRYGVRPA